MDQNYLNLYLNDFISGFDKGCLKILRKTYLGMFETLHRRQKYVGVFWVFFFVPYKAT